MQRILITALTAWWYCHAVAGAAGQGSAPAMPVPANPAPGGPAADRIATPTESRAEQEVPDPVLLALRSRLEGGLADLKPALTFEVPAGSGGKSMLMRFKTREYLVYPHDMTGRLGPDPVKDEGPGDGGVLLRIHVQPEGEVNQACVPQTLHEPYWSTSLNVYPVAGTGKQIFVALSFRNTTAGDLLQRIQKIVQQQPGAGMGPEDPANELTGVFHAAVAMDPSFLEIDGTGFIQRIIVTGDALQNLADGTRVRVKGRITTDLYGSADKAAQDNQQAPTQWFIVMHVDQCRKITKPFETSKAHQSNR